jgi:hypothetical protein
MIITIIIIILLGIFQAIMQGTMFYNTYAKLDKQLFKDRIFFKKKSPKKKDWSIKIFSKTLFLFNYFPFIMFTDLFHFAHSIFGLLLGALVANIYYQMYQTTDAFIAFVATSLIYSTVFHFKLSFMKNIEKIKKYFSKP